MKFQRCSSSRCGRPYQVNEFSGQAGGGTDTGVIICPHCGHTETRWCDSVFLVHALSAEQEAQFEQNTSSV
ncbi:hypothetical protein [Noviherbaspirillum galbum]|uniref:Uncharacterized protein n=1 Tax=Noviherbaspirillum galbum TaxID=2709383 RepID=A0A6B3SZ31_9BURK|nr:hypothetical protein [Noviherbaspirillum galbum]NEX63589.1 hypothetical protein [Noviherbaspirillum galbum]